MHKASLEAVHSDLCRLIGAGCMLASSSLSSPHTPSLSLKILYFEKERSYRLSFSCHNSLKALQMSLSFANKVYKKTSPP